MGSPVNLYQKEMHDNLGFFATWLPGDPLQVGDAGVLEGGRFRKLTSLAELGITMKVVDGQGMHDLQYTSTHGTSISFSAGADVAAIAKAEIRIQFSRRGAFVFHASTLMPRGLDNRASVGEGLVKMYEAGKWKKEWLLVESLHVAERATVIVSEDQSAELVLNATAEMPISGISLSDPRVGLTVASTHGKIVHIIGGTGMHPLYSCLRVKESWFTQPSVQPVRGAGPNSSSVPFTRVSIEELLNS